ncbi:MAG TPA: UDP-3-O-(3-hydroxymyristoyl)glucosamine N-acyltransferase [Alphaproteobacteria bacterium]|nr:UDP-3-O-(3-hydroxymyristoyl)glucosamine N-acyltransferase [Alphaproteobacteria bacterium]
MAKVYTTAAIAEKIEGRLIGDGNIVIARVAHPADVQGPGDLALAVDNRLVPLLAGGQARAAVVAEASGIEPGLMDACIVVGRSRLAMARLSNLFFEPVPVTPGLHPSAVIEDGAQLGENITLGALAFIGAGAVIGAGSVIHPQAYIGPGAVIGRDALIYPGARIGAGVRIGDRCIVHFNAAIGADGFSFVTPEPGSVEAARATGAVAATNKELVRIASLGGVEIGDDVEIGASSCIDRGTVAATRIGNGTKIDNQVQVGHNVVIGANCLVCGRVGIAGSAAIGDRVVLGGAAGVADHVKIGDDVVAMAMSGIAGNVPAKTIVGGIPAQPRARMLENYFYAGRLKHYAEKVNALIRRMDAIERKSQT